MADTKRQNAGGKVPVATPNIGSSGIVSLETALSGVIGARIRLATTASQTLEGTLFTACPITNLIALNTAPPPPTPTSSTTAPQPGDYHIIPISRIQSFNLLSLPDASSGTTITNFENAQPSIGMLDMNALKAREDAAIKVLKEREQKRGKGVGKEAQDIFDILGKTMSTRWHETSIVVLDAVIITPPYRPEDCKAPAGQQTALNRVKKVLDIERKKLAERTNKPAVPTVTPNSGLRKGG
ncbi:MAG: hypothetical protein M1827_004909 [Pycnora praestabilis]|nr:MAG: hypothetical protein M1827_004909 [Pycnora praestabilis]